MGIKLGLALIGYDAEVVKQIIQMENEDIDRVKGQGVGPERCSSVKELLRLKRVDMVLLKKTKRSCIDVSVVKSLWPIDSMEFMAVVAIGSAGGLLCIWNPEVFSLKECCCSRSFIILGGTMYTSLNCFVGNIYAPNEDVNKRRLWSILVNLKFAFPDLWKFTWGNSQNWSKIDRFLVNPEWLEWYKYKVWGLSRLFSDHSPILLMEDDTDWGPKSFKYINACVLHLTFLDEVKRVWDSTRVQGWASYVIMEKLRVLKVALKRLNMTVFGDVDSKLKKTEIELHSLDLQSELRVSDEVEKGKRKERLKNPVRLNKQLATISKVYLLNNGGWKFLQDDIMKFMKEFYSNSKLGYGVNCSFVTPIPKKENPNSLIDYWPISLINSLYKVLSKVLANRFKQVLPSVINKVQFAFVGERNVLDIVLIENEVVD
ncbi:uncharacterized protein LOC114290049 [Camellia sinensis]|uniref:uncharacterized protein LOC114290049 n=1 Tax=Camellia sinensis TaxID=4442 RepID=UPI00103670A0|nr:uncharacterized protein LOC114290049 [Camellia sinensis]